MPERSGYDLSDFKNSSLLKPDEGQSPQVGRSGGSIVAAICPPRLLVGREGVKATTADAIKKKRLMLLMLKE